MAAAATAGNINDRLFSLSVVGVVYVAALMVGVLFSKLRNQEKAMLVVVFIVHFPFQS